MSSIIEIKSILNDCRLKTKGGILAGLDLWELGVMPMLLNNSSTWYNISQPAITRLEGLQNDMFRNLFNTPRTTPKISLWWDLGALPIEFRIKK